MASKVEIYNLALNHLGMESLDGLSGSDPSTVACNTFYDPCLNDVFSEARWPFATVKELLATLSDDVLGWEYVYQYPTQAAKVWCVYNEATVDDREEQVFETIYLPDSNKRAICCDLDEAYAEYTYKVPDTTLYDFKFTMALSYRLAASMAHQLLGDGRKGLSLMEIYNAFIGEAKRLAFAEKIRKPTRNSGYQDAR